VGRGRVEDTWDLLGRALRTVVTCAAKTLQIPREAVLAGAGVTLLGAPSLKAALDIDWGDPAAQADALARLLAEVDRVEARTRPFTGCQRHVMKLMDADLVVGVDVRPANEPEHRTLAILEPAVTQVGPLAELQIDRGFWPVRAWARCTPTA
jgi:hypothetical protein